MKEVMKQLWAVLWRRVRGIDAGDLHFCEIVMVAAFVETLA